MRAGSCGDLVVSPKSATRASERALRRDEGCTAAASREGNMIWGGEGQEVGGKRLYTWSGICIYDRE
jgi:hypothetical protein